MKKILIFISLAVAFVGCYKTEIYNTSHPDKGEVVIKITSDTFDEDEEYTLLLNGTEVEVDENGEVVFPDYLDEGEYTVYIFNSPAGVTIDSLSNENGIEEIIASVDFVSSGVVDGDAGILYFGTKTFTVVADAVIDIDVDIQQITRQLHFSLTLDGDAISRITSISALLDGVSQQWACVSNLHYGTAASVAPLLTQGTTLSGSVYLLGIDPSDTQTLTITLEYANDNPTSHEVIVADITTQLSGFNDNKSVPLTLNGNVTTPTEVTSGENTIIDWVVNEGGEITVY